LTDCGRISFSGIAICFVSFLVQRAEFEVFIEKKRFCVLRTTKGFFITTKGFFMTTKGFANPTQGF